MAARGISSQGIQNDRDTRKDANGGIGALVNSVL
jgi:hypothetical protein